MRWMWIICCLVGIWPAWVQGGELSGRLRIQLGQEYDSNAPRQNIAHGDWDLLSKLVIQGHMNWAASSHLLSLDYHGGAKVFYQHPDEHLVANSLALSYRYGLRNSPALGARLSAKDVTQARHNRDYLISTIEVFLRSKPATVLGLEFFAGGRHFAFKPDWNSAGDGPSNPNYSHLGQHAGLRMLARPSPDWQLGSSLRYSTRYFDTKACRFEASEPDQLLSCVAQADERQDERYTAGLRLRYQTHWWDRYRLIIRGSYWFSFNSSNSAGGTARWHRLQAVLSVQLPADLALHLMGNLQLTAYPDGILEEDRKTYMVDADENENSLVAKLTWRMWDELSLLMQAAVYRNTFIQGASDLTPFARETLQLGVSYDWSFRDR